MSDPCKVFLQFSIFISPLAGTLCLLPWALPGRDLQKWLLHTTEMCWVGLICREPIICFLSLFKPITSLTMETVSWSDFVSQMWETAYFMTIKVSCNFSLEFFPCLRTWGFYFSNSKISISSDKNLSAQQERNWGFAPLYSFNRMNV